MILLKSFLHPIKVQIIWSSFYNVYMWYVMSGRDIVWMLKLVDESELIKDEIFNYLMSF